MFFEIYVQQRPERNAQMYTKYVVKNRSLYISLAISYIVLIFKDELHNKIINLTILLMLWVILAFNSELKTTRLQKFWFKLNFLQQQSSCSPTKWVVERIPTASEDTHMFSGIPNDSVFGNFKRGIVVYFGDRITEQTPRLFDPEAQWRQ